VPYAENDDIRIFYKTIGEGFPLVLQHGFTGSHETWFGRRKEVNYVEALQKRYQLVLLDARGHGKSSKPHDPEKYTTKKMVEDIVTVLDELSIEKAAFWGYSMGGSLGLGAGKYAPDRFCSYVIGGAGLSERDSKERVQRSKGYVKLLEQGAEAFIALLEDLRGSKYENREKERWMNADLDAYIACSSFYENIGMSEYLPDILTPFLIYVGEEDWAYLPAKECAEIIPNAQFVSFPGLNHFGASTGSKVVLPYVLKFLEETINA
jgi:pimeloyl-ACP methyl ester carboxylesterase